MSAQREQRVELSLFMDGSHLTVFVRGLTGAGVPRYATTGKQHLGNRCSRCALIAGGTPAVPVFALRDYRARKVHPNVSGDFRCLAVRRHVKRQRTILVMTKTLIL